MDVGRLAISKAMMKTEKLNMVIYTQNPMEKPKISKSTLSVNHLLSTQTTTQVFPLSDQKVRLHTAFLPLGGKP